MVWVCRPCCNSEQHTKMLTVLALISAALAPQLASGQATVPRLGGVNTAGFDFTVVRT